MKSINCGAFNIEHDIHTYICEQKAHNKKVQFFHPSLYFIYQSQMSAQRNICN
jgi:uncharacterized membrane protein YhfC